MSIIAKCYGEEITIFIHSFTEVVSQEILRSNSFYEFPFLDWCKSNYPCNGGDVIDIGANIGNHSLFYASFTNCSRVHAFEPHPDNLEILRKNLNRFEEGKCIIYDYALSNVEGCMKLYNSQQNNHGGFSLHNFSDGSSFLVKDKVNVKTLDSLGLTNISMIKIDVENHENEVLEGARNTIQNNKPIIFIENLYHMSRIIQPDDNIHGKLMKEFGYTRVASNVLGSFMDVWAPDE